MYNPTLPSIIKWNWIPYFAVGLLTNPHYITWLSTVIIRYELFSICSCPHAVLFVPTSPGCYCFLFFYELRIKWKYYCISCIHCAEPCIMSFMWYLMMQRVRPVGWEFGVDWMWVHLSWIRYSPLWVHDWGFFFPVQVAVNFLRTGLVWQYMCVALTVKHNYFIG